ncbi:hypothetical protein V5O48_016508 [Marasmius crinis-equi]|uniref:Peptidase A2 domain-containing protein n=1 Tax=Marasmius crinis-equi TaxID=585013 RepID=A0ABR3ERI4_9AGAR
MSNQPVVEAVIPQGVYQEPISNAGANPRAPTGHAAVTHASPAAEVQARLAATASGTPSHLLSSIKAQVDPVVLLPALVSLPQPYSRDAPRLFKGSYAKVEGWLSQYEKVAKKYGVKEDKEKCEGLLDYCSLKVKRTIRSLTSFRNGDWDAFKQDILKLYDAARARQQYQPSDIQALARRQSSSPIDNLSKWLKYRRRFQEKGGELVPSGKMTDQQLATYFWLGIPELLRKLLELQLCAKFPQRDNTVPYPIPDICHAAEQYFSRSHFVSTVPDAEAFGTLAREEDSGDDSDSEEDSDSDMEELELWRKLFRGKVKDRTKGKEGASEVAPPPTRVVPDLATKERIRATQFSGSQAEVAELISRLNGMKLDNPEYGALYYRATTLDPNSRTCITRAPALAPVPTLPTASYNQPGGVQRPLVPITADGQTVRMIPFEKRPPAGPRFACNGCGSATHRMSECGGISERQQKGELKWDSAQRKLVTAEGRVIERQRGENLLQALDRMISEARQSSHPANPQSMLYKLLDSGQQRRPQPSGSAFLERVLEEDPSEEEYADEDLSSSEGWEDEEDEFESSTEEEEDYISQGSESAASLAAVLHADRTTPKGKDIRMKTSAGPREGYQAARSKRHAMPPKRADGSRPTWQEAVGTAKRRPVAKDPVPRTTSGSPPPRTLPADIFDEPAQVPTASVEPSTTRNVSFPPPREPINETPSIEPTPRLKDTHIPLNPKPYDARTSSARRATSLEPRPLPRPTPMDSQRRPTVRFAEPETPQTMVENKGLEERTKRGEKLARKSELARRVDKQSILDRLLGTQVQVTLGEVLGTSRELSSAFHDLSKVRLSQEKPLSKKVAHVNTIISPESGRVMFTKNAKLIEFFLEFNGRKIRAILDTGSQINVMNTAVYEEVIRLPIDLREYTIMNDANGGVRRLDGAVDDLPLMCGSVETRGFYFVGDSVPFSLLLGRPWISDNAVSIDERRNGTYLVFKDPETWEPIYEMIVATRPGRGPHYRLGGETERHMRSYHVGLAQEEAEEVPDSEQEQRQSPDITTDSPNHTLPSGFATEEKEDESISEIPERQRSFSPTFSTDSAYALRPVMWHPSPGNEGEVENEGSTNSLDSAWNEDESEGHTFQRGTVQALVGSPGIGGTQMTTDLLLLMKVWLRIWVVASATLLLRLCQTMEHLIRTYEEDKRREEGDRELQTTTATPSCHSYLLRMSDSTNSSISSSEAGPQPSTPPPALEAISLPRHPIPERPPNPQLRALLEQRAARIPVPPVLTKPGPLHHPPFDSALTPNALVREACLSAVDALATTGRVPTRPAIAVSPQAYYLQERNRPGVGPSQTYVALNAGLIVYNPELQRSSHQQGHLHMEFFPKSNASPLAPQAADQQHFNYLFEPALLPNGQRNDHKIESADVHIVSGQSPRMGVPRPVTVNPSHLTSKLGEEREEGEVEGEIPVLVDVPSDMDIDSSSGTDDTDSGSGAAPQVATTEEAPPDSAGLQLPEPLHRPRLQPGRPIPTFIPDSPPPATSLALVPTRRPAVTLVERGRLMERSTQLPARAVPHPDRVLAGSILEITRRLPREHVGDPIFTVAEGPCQTPDWQFTSLFRLENGAIIAESKKTLVERLITAFSPVSAEIYYQLIEEGMEGCWGPTDDPDFTKRMHHNLKLQTPETRQLMVSKFRYRVGVARGQAIQPIILSAQAFDANEFARAWVVRKIPATEAGRWKCRKLPYVYINQELFRFMVMFAEYLMLRNLDHVFRARYHAYRGAPRFISEKHGHLLGNKLLTWDVRVWLLVAWEMLVFMREVELAALVNTALRMRFLDNESLDNLHRGHLFPELPSELPGTYVISWDEVMYPMESYTSFVANVFQTPHVPVGPNYVHEHVIDSDAETVPKENVTVLQLKYPIPPSPASSSSSSGSSSSASPHCSPIEVEL